MSTPNPLAQQSGELAELQAQTQTQLAQIQVNNTDDSDTNDRSNTMNSPNPVPSGWTPTTSTVAGGVIGGAAAQIITAVVEALAHTTLSTATAGAISTLAVVIAGYFFPDGGRK